MCLEEQCGAPHVRVQEHSGKRTPGMAQPPSVCPHSPGQADRGAQGVNYGGRSLMSISRRGGDRTRREECVGGRLECSSADMPGAGET